MNSGWRLVWVLLVAMLVGRALAEIAVAGDPVFDGAGVRCQEVERC